MPASAALLAWLTEGHSSRLIILEREIAALMGDLRAARTPAERKALEDRLRPLVVKRREILARGRGEAA